MALLFYKRPDYMNKHQGPITSSECSHYVERARNSKQAIPEGLSFEKVMCNLSLPPCGLGDFMDYLYYIEKAAENLQFVLWYNNYSRRFNAMPEAQKSLSPKWKDEIAEYDDSSVEAEKFDRLYNEAFPWQPFTIQPMRDEIDRIMHHYIVRNSPRALNLSPMDRARCLHALQHTTHPSALSPAFNIANLTLQGQSHPNFIRWSICNGNKPRVLFLRTSGILSILIGFLATILMILSGLNRWYRIFILIPWFIGLTMLIATHNGLCILLHQTRVRDVRPWEQFVFDQETGEGRSSFYSSSNPNGVRQSTELVKTVDSHLIKFQTFGPRNSYENESWVKKYEETPILRKIFPKTVWSQDQTLKMIQDRIILGAFFWASILSFVLVAVAVAIPLGYFY
ncbi:hypothetical protein K3495_g9057 [Podosphaera aphanis]|nr:hypothetical protein K3495_g9057 [Podosphaera aphanis]